VFKLFYILLIGLLSEMAFADDHVPLIVEMDKKLFVQAVEFSLDKQWSQAEPIYRDLLTRHKYWPELGNNLALLLLQTDRLNEAEKMFEQALRGTPSYKTTLHNRSQLYQYLASRAYDRALGEHKPAALPPLTLIETIYQIKKNTEKEIYENEYVEDSALSD